MKTYRISYTEDKNYIKVEINNHSYFISIVEIEGFDDIFFDINKQIRHKKLKRILKK